VIDERVEQLALGAHQVAIGVGDVEAVGHAALEALVNGRRNRMIVMKGRAVTDIDILDVAHKQRTIPGDHTLLAAARAVGTAFGD